MIWLKIREALELGHAIEGLLAFSYSKTHPYLVCDAQFCLDSRNLNLRLSTVSKSIPMYSHLLCLSYIHPKKVIAL